ncbi:MAG: hypothetical protein ACI8PT_000700 [Gammaproteobacteria bacterium]|jgi:hypothetical protein
MANFPAAIIGSRVWRAGATLQTSPSGSIPAGSIPGVSIPGASSHRPGHLSTGFSELDKCLPGGGWPRGAITEVLYDHHGIGELRLVMPILVSVTRSGGNVVWVAPPYIPYAPALSAEGVELSRVLWVGAPSWESFRQSDQDSRRDSSQKLPRKSGRSGAGTEYLWAAEQALRQAACGAVLLWLAHCPEEGKILRRLQIAAEVGGGCGILFRPHRAAAHASPAAVRLVLDASANGTQVRLLKCRGRAPKNTVLTL